MAAFLESNLPGPSVLFAADTENQELEKVQAALARTPRLAKLLCYLVRHYFEGTTDHLTEFNIATEVFDRNPETFIASDDAIARVETHRLRKRLTLFYDGEGKHHPVQVSIPLGTYVPLFTHKTTAKPTIHEFRGSMPVLSEHIISSAEQGLLSPNESSLPTRMPPERRRIDDRFWRLTRRQQYGFAILCVVLLCGLGVYTGFRISKSRMSGVTAIAATSGASPRASMAAVSAATGVAVPFRMIAGYSGPPQKDAEGFLWQSDQYFVRGWPVHRPEVYVRGTSNPLIFQFGRDGDSDYDIPLKPGNYELHLYFMQPAETALGEDSENKAVFNLALNGKTILSEFDIVSDAMGRNTADERVFRDVSPAKDGKLHLHLSTVVGTPSLSAIEILDGTPGKQLPIRLVTQPMPRTDRDGVVWRPDNYFTGGRYLSHNLPNADMAVQDVLSTERYGHFTYDIPVDVRDRYTVSLSFVEQHFGTPESTEGGLGNRIFKVMCNGNTFLDAFDVYKEGGSFHVVQKTFYHVKPSAEGKLNLTFEPIVNYATVSAIQVLDEGQ